MSNHRAALADIKQFSQLIAYLRDEMGWPIKGGDFEELTFDFTPEELGIDLKTAAKIQEIKRLRPLSPSQPWGIFFVKFEPKKLPVVALRRILSQVAIKKRASANNSERTAWAADDLLFISNYGESGDGRQISFAHFSQAESRQDLPTLKVLGWDSRDTALHLDGVWKELTEHLAWPTNERDGSAWREAWRSAFTVEHREVINTSKELAESLANLAGNIRDRIKTTLKIENDKGPLRTLMVGFQKSLIHDLDSDGFADMYAQTIAYGLLSARIAQPTGSSADDLAAHMRTSPFLRELMETFLKVGGRRGKAGGPGIDFDELGVSEVQDLLERANMNAILVDFGDRNQQEDPVMHFFEGFLQAYDAKIKKDRGVFYTPHPVVSYIVRSVHELLQTEFGLVDGLADTITWGEMCKSHKDLQIPQGTSSDQAFVQILDPATGTGTFIVEVIDIIHKTMTAKWAGQSHGEKKVESLWNEYVPKHLLPRLHAYELMMAPYAIAHLKVGLKLKETGYGFGSDERARIYLTNALEPAQDFSGTFEFAIPALAHEAQAVNEVKRNQRFTVVIGNPPYSNFGQLNKIPFIRGMLEDYKRGLEEKKLNLDDDFIKFVRYSQHLLSTTDVGVMGMITNNVFFDGITHRKMRECLQATFPLIRVLDLHGNIKKQETSPDGSKDENVFEIQQGVGISLMVRFTGMTSRRVEHADLWGLQGVKYEALNRNVVTNQSWTLIKTIFPHFFFVPKVLEGAEEYLSSPTLPTLFHFVGQGIQTKQDRFALQNSKSDISQVVDDVRMLSIRQLMVKYALPETTPSWSLHWAKSDVTESQGCLIKVKVKPFDSKWTYFSGKSNGFLSRPRRQSTECLLRKNVAIVAKRQTKDAIFSSIFVVDSPINEGFFAIDPKGRESIFPLFASHQTHSSNDQLFRIEKGLVSNLNSDALAGQYPAESPEDIFHYAYAVLHSPSYRSRYAEFLKIDFPRLPLTGNLELFRALARLGGELTALHLLESPKLAQPITEFIGGRNPEVGRVGWTDDTVWLDAAATKKGQPATPGTIGFKGVREDVWNFHIGGYQVCAKWLKDRKGRKLSKEDIAHYQKIVVALSETIRLMKEIDEVIVKHGGWPGAFETNSNSPTKEPAKENAVSNKD